MYNPLEVISVDTAKEATTLIDELKESHLIKLNTSEGTYFQLYNYSAISDLPDTWICKMADHWVQSGDHPAQRFFQVSTKW